MSGVEDPDEQLEYGVRMIKEGYRRKVGCEGGFVI
jgi:hypothetical protein